MHASSTFEPKLTYTVPIDWTNFQDRSDMFGLVPPGGDWRSIDPEKSDDVIVMTRGHAHALATRYPDVGPAPREQADAIWERFRTGLDRLREERREPEVEVAEQPPVDPGRPQSRFENRLPLAGIAERLGVAPTADPGAQREGGAGAGPAATPTGSATR